MRKFLKSSMPDLVLPPVYFNRNMLFTGLYFHSYSYRWLFCSGLRLCTESERCLERPFSADDFRTDIRCLKIMKKKKHK